MVRKRTSKVSLMDTLTCALAEHHSFSENEFSAQIGGM
jgi:hypothetical protein